MLLILILILLYSTTGEVLAEPQIKIETSNLEYQEPEVIDNRLRIVCPKCHRALYICDIDEFFFTYTLDGDRSQLDSCKPLFKRLNPIIIGKEIPRCPFDNQLPCDTNSKCFTNKGWQPTRQKGRYNE